MYTISHLPPEALLTIFSHLSPRRILRSNVLVCRSWHNIVRSAIVPDGKPWVLTDVEYKPARGSFYSTFVTFTLLPEIQRRRLPGASGAIVWALAKCTVTAPREFFHPDGGIPALGDLLLPHINKRGGKKRVPPIRLVVNSVSVTYAPVPADLVPPSLIALAHTVEIDARGIKVWRDGSSASVLAVKGVNILVQPGREHLPPPPSLMDDIFTLFPNAMHLTLPMYGHSLGGIVDRGSKSAVMEACNHVTSLTLGEEVPTLPSTPQDETHRCPIATVIATVFPNVTHLDLSRHKPESLFDPNPLQISPRPSVTHLTLELRRSHFDSAFRSSLRTLLATLHIAYCGLTTLTFQSSFDEDRGWDFGSGVRPVWIEGLKRVSATVIVFSGGSLDELQYAVRAGQKRYKKLLSHPRQSSNVGAPPQQTAEDNQAQVADEPKPSSNQSTDDPCESDDDIDSQSDNDSASLSEEDLEGVSDQSDTDSDDSSATSSSLRARRTRAKIPRWLFKGRIPDKETKTRALETARPHFLRFFALLSFELASVGKKLVLRETPERERLGTTLWYEYVSGP